MDEAIHPISPSCGGEKCMVCSEPATHKIGEEHLHGVPRRMHNLTAYVCCEHFGMVMGPFARSHCGVSEPPADEPLSREWLDDKYGRGSAAHPDNVYWTIGFVNVGCEMTWMRVCEVDTDVFLLELRTSEVSEDENAKERGTATLEVRTCGQLLRLLDAAGA